MTEIYLGYPPENVKAWILAHKGGSEPAAKRETVLYFSDGTSEEHLIEGTLDWYWMIDNGYYDDCDLVWKKTITKAEIGTSVTNVGYWAFRGCGGLTSVTIPEGVTGVGFEAFYNCNGLTSVTIPSSVTSIGFGAFSDADNSPSVTVHVPNQTIKDLLVEDSGFTGTIVIDGQADEEPAAKTPVWGEGVWHVIFNGTNEYTLSNDQYDPGANAYYQGEITVMQGGQLAYQDVWYTTFDATKSERQDVTFIPPSDEAPTYSATVWWTES